MLTPLVEWAGPGCPGACHLVCCGTQDLERLPQCPGLCQREDRPAQYKRQLILLASPTPLLYDGVLIKTVPAAESRHASERLRGSV
jgi:hypothetical protein